MTSKEYLNLIVQYTDNNKLIKPNVAYTDSGNGLLYASIDVLLRNIYNIEQSEVQYTLAVTDCMKEPGLLMRTPQNSYGYEQFDDYMGTIAAFTTLNNTTIPQNIYIYAVTHLFNLNNIDPGKFTIKSFLGRYPHLWVLTFASAFRFFKYLLFPILITIPYFFTPNINDTSGTQLQWVFVKAVENLYNIKLTHWENKFVNVYGSNPLNVLFTKYYGPDHPFAKITK
jgi:hypothetical protein